MHIVYRSIKSSRDNERVDPKYVLMVERCMKKKKRAAEQ